MFSFCKQIAVAAPMGLAALTLAVSPAHGQNPFFQVSPALALQQQAYNAAILGRASAFGSPFGMGFNPYAAAAVQQNFAAAAAASQFNNPYAGGAASLVTNPYSGGAATMMNNANPYTSGYSPYNPYGYYQSPFQGYLSGAADVINSQGRYLISRQQANLLREQGKQAALDTQRKRFEEYLYEREKTPTPEEERERSRVQERDRSRNDPPVTEIWSAKALNDLLTDLQKQQAKGTLATYRGPQIPLDEDDLKRINVTSRSGGGNIGLLKNDGRLSWPAALAGPTFKEERDRISSLAQDAVKQAGFNTPVDPGTLQQMSADLAKLNKQLTASVGDLPPNQYMEAKRFLGSFDDALKALRLPDAGNYFTKKIKAKSIPELVDYMTKQGLQFAPAVAGDESAYVGLHRALAAYDTAVQGPVAERQ